MPIVKLPDGSRVKFPDNMTPEEMSAAIAGDTTPAEPEQTAEPGTWGEAISQASQNLPSSAASFAENMAQPVLHPVDTAQALSNLTVDDVKSMVKDRYGSIENFKKTVAKDPVGVLADFSTVLTGAGGLARMGGAGVVAKGLSMAGKATDPLVLAAAPIKKVGQTVAEHGVVPGMGAMSGIGKAPYEEAFKGTEGVVEGMRGKINPQTIYGNAKDAMDSLRQQRGADYSQRLAQVKQAGNTLNIAPVKQRLVKLMDDFNIKRNPDGTFDFSRSTLDKGAYADAQYVIEMIDDWGTRGGDLTPAGFDILKRKLDDFYSPNKNSRAIVTSLRNTVKDEIVRNVPEYATMTKNYEEMTGLVKEMEQAISLNSRASADTAVRKLLNVMKENNEFRQDLLREIDGRVGSNLVGELAGNQLNPWHPQGWLGRSVDAGALLSIFMGANPKVLGVLALSSPRLLGEFTNALGQAYKGYKSVRSKVPYGTGKALYQAGRLQGVGTQGVVE